MHTEAHLFSVPNDCLWYDKLWGPSQRVVTLFSLCQKERKMLVKEILVFWVCFNFDEGGAVGQDPPLDSDVVVQDPLVLEGPDVAGQLGVLPLLCVLEVGLMVSVP